MKRTFKAAAAIAAMVLALSLFAACDDDDDRSSSYSIGRTYDFSSFTKATAVGTAGMRASTGTLKTTTRTSLRMPS